jgi:hypothetical protein
VERRWAGPLYGRDAVTVVGRGSVVGRELVGWVAAADGGEEGGASGGGGGRRWLSGVFPSSARDIAARFTERVLRPSGQGWLHACVGAVVAGHASLLMDEDEVGEWEPLPEVPAYPLVSAWGLWEGEGRGGRVWRPLHTHVCVRAGGGRRGCCVAVAHARVGRCGGAVGQAGSCGGGAAACGGVSGSCRSARGDRGGTDGGAGDAARVRACASTCTRTWRWRGWGSGQGRCRWRCGCSERWGASARPRGSRGGSRSEAGREGCGGWGSGGCARRPSRSEGWIACAGARGGTEGGESGWWRRGSWSSARSARNGGSCGHLATVCARTSTSDSAGGGRQWCKWRCGLSRGASACAYTSSNARGDR